MQTKTILIIEDDKMNMKLVRALLTLGKHDMLEAENAEIGIQMAREHCPDLILMDIQLPGLDGLSATRAIKKETGIGDIPIVALTSYAMVGDKEKALEAGCDGYLTKPIDTRCFLDAIARYLDAQ
ncbi:MAG: response regulator [Desulfatiglans sp.]|nr:response regulator [Desulfatiglans sp.]